MRHIRILLSAALAATAMSCGDLQGPTELRTPAGPLFNAEEDCFPSAPDMTLNPSSSTITQGTSQSFTASSALGRDRYSGESCFFAPGTQLQFIWAVSNAGLATVGGQYVNGTTGGAEIHGTSPGTVQVTVTVRRFGRPESAASRTVSMTIVAPTPTPTVTTFTGPTTLTAAGEYYYSLAASGGNGSSYTYQVEKSTNGGATWTVVFNFQTGSSTTAPIQFAAGEVGHLRARVKSGTSAWSAYSAVLVVDATAAAPQPSVWISGYDNIRYTGTHSFEAMPSGGNGTYTYLWRLERPDGSFVQSTDKVFFWNFGPCDGEQAFPLEVTVTSNGASSAAYTLVNVDYQNQC